MSVPIFLQCDICEARWQICSVPIAADTFIKAMKAAVCPHCNATTKSHLLCHTDGPHAVTEARGPQKPVKVEGGGA